MIPGNTTSISSPPGSPAAGTAGSHRGGYPPDFISVKANVLEFLKSRFIGMLVLAFFPGYNSPQTNRNAHARGAAVFKRNGSETGVW